jgi:hypothetical protein
MAQPAKESDQAGNLLNADCWFLDIGPAFANR